MNKLIEKHKKALNSHVIMDNKVCGINCASDTHANITKEVACGFAEWARVKTINSLKGYIILDRTEGFFTLDQLFDLYIKSL